MTRAALLGGDARDEEEGQAAKGGGGGGGSAGNNDKGEDEEEEEEADDGGLSQPLSSFGSAKLDALMAIDLAVVERNRRAKRAARTAAAAAAAAGRSGGGAPPSGPSPPPPRLGLGLGRPRDAPEKVVVFSQWTSMLDLVCAALTREGVRFSRIDGGMNPAQRSATVAAFQAEGDGEDDEGGEERENGAAAPPPPPTTTTTTAADSVPVIVVSLKAASLGLNLTAASTVVLLDPWFNRATEQQAADRAHRLGQRAAEVRVVRLVAEGTVEERVVQLAEDKMRVAAAALGGERGMGGMAAGTMGAGVSGEELRFLITGLR